MLKDITFYLDMLNNVKESMIYEDCKPVNRFFFVPSHQFNKVTERL